MFATRSCSACSRATGRPERLLFRGGAWPWVAAAHSRRRTIAGCAGHRPRAVPNRSSWLVPLVSKPMLVNERSGPDSARQGARYTSCAGYPAHRASCHRSHASRECRPCWRRDGGLLAGEPGFLGGNSLLGRTHRRPVATNAVAAIRVAAMKRDSIFMGSLPALSGPLWQTRPVAISPEAGVNQPFSFVSNS